MKIETQSTSIAVNYKATPQETEQSNFPTSDVSVGAKELDTAKFISDSKARIEELASASVADITKSPQVAASVTSIASQVIAKLHEIPSPNATLPEIVGTDVRNIVHYGFSELDEMRKVFGKVITDLGGSQELADKAIEILLKHVVVDGATGKVTLDHTASWDSFMQELDTQVLSKISPIGDLLGIDKKGNFRAGLNATIMRALDSVTGNYDTNSAIKLICNGDQRAANLLDIVMAGGNVFLMASGLLEGALMEGDYPPHPPRIPYPPAPEMFGSVNILGVNVPTPNLLYPVEVLAHNATCMWIDGQNMAADIAWQQQCSQVRDRKLADIQAKLTTLQQKLDAALMKEQPVMGPDGKQQINKDGTPMVAKVSVFEIAMKDFHTRNKANVEMMEAMANDIAQLNAKQALGDSLRQRCLSLLKCLKEKPDDPKAQKELLELSKGAKSLAEEIGALVNRIKERSRSLDMRQNSPLPPVLQNYEDAIVNLSMLSIDSNALSPEVLSSISGIVSDVQAKLNGGARVGFNSLNETTRTRLMEAVRNAKTDKDIAAIGNLMDLFDSNWGHRIKDAKSRLLEAKPEARKDLVAILEWRNLPEAK